MTSPPNLGNLVPFFGHQKLCFIKCSNQTVDASAFDSSMLFSLSHHLRTPFSIAGRFTFLPVIHAARTIHNQDEQRQRSPPCMGRQISTRSSTRSATTVSTQLSSQSSVIVSSTLGTLSSSQCLRPGASWHWQNALTTSTFLVWGLENACHYCVLQSRSIHSFTYIFSIIRTYSWFRLDLFPHKW